MPKTEHPGKSWTSAMRASWEPEVPNSFWKVSCKILQLFTHCRSNPTLDKIFRWNIDSWGCSNCPNAVGCIGDCQNHFVCKWSLMLWICCVDWVKTYVGCYGWGKIGGRDKESRSGQGRGWWLWGGGERGRQSVDRCILVGRLLRLSMNEKKMFHTWTLTAGWGTLDTLCGKKFRRMSTWFGASTTRWFTTGRWGSCQKIKLKSGLFVLSLVHAWTQNKMLRTEK